MATNMDTVVKSAQYTLDRTENNAKSLVKQRGISILQGLLGNEAIPEISVELRPATVEKSEQIEKWWFRHAPLRQIVIVASFLLLVATPAALTSLYMTFVAADQYHSSSSFAVRSIESAGASDILGMFTQSSNGSTVSDSYILMDFILSERMVEAADKKFGLSNIFAVRGFDYYYGLHSDLPIEEKLKYWREMVQVTYDHASGIMKVTVRAFDPNQSRELAAFIVRRSDDLVNSLSLTARNDVLRGAQDEILAGEARLTKARQALREYRDRSQEVSPEEGAKLALQLIGSLEQQLTQLNADLAIARSQLSDDTPRVRLLKTRIASLEQQLELERQRLGTGERVATAKSDVQAQDVAGRIALFEELETEREFAERAYTSALAALEKARVEANNRQRYLALYIEPTLSEKAQYPTRLINTLLVGLGALFLWSIGIMIFYNIRDRA